MATVNDDDIFAMTPFVSLDADKAEFAESLNCGSKKRVIDAQLLSDSFPTATVKEGASRQHGRVLNLLSVQVDTKDADCADFQRLLTTAEAFAKDEGFAAVCIKHIKHQWMRDVLSERGYIGAGHMTQPISTG